MTSISDNNQWTTPAALQTKHTLLGKAPSYLVVANAGQINAAAATGQENAPDDESRIISALSSLPADDYDQWWKMGLVLHRSNIASERARQIWIDWSATCPAKFCEQSCIDKWASFSASEKPSTAVSLGSLFHAAQQAGWIEPQKAAHEWRTPDALPTEPPPKPYPTASLPTLMHDAVKAIAHHVAAPEPCSTQAGSERGFGLKGAKGKGDIYVYGFHLSAQPKNQGRNNHPEIIATQP